MQAQNLMHDPKGSEENKPEICFIIACLSTVPTLSAVIASVSYNIFSATTKVYPVTVRFLGTEVYGQHRERPPAWSCRPAYIPYPAYRLPVDERDLSHIIQICYPWYLQPGSLFGLTGWRSVMPSSSRYSTMG